MGFWQWLIGGSKRVTEVDKIWLTRAASRGEICRETQEHLAEEQPLLLLAQFPATLAAIQEELSTQGIPHRTIVGRLSTKDGNRLAEPMSQRVIQVGLAAQLQPESFPDKEVEKDGMIQILVAERHFLRQHDDAIIDFANTLRKPCRVTFYLSLEDPLMKVFAGEWVKGVLERMGANESTLIESAMVARRIRQAQGKFAGRPEPRGAVHSAEDWLQAVES